MKLQIDFFTPFLAMTKPLKPMPSSECVNDNRNHMKMEKIRRCFFHFLPLINLSVGEKACGKWRNGIDSVTDNIYKKKNM